MEQITVFVDHNRFTAWSTLSTNVSGQPIKAKYSGFSPSEVRAQFKQRIKAQTGLKRLSIKYLDLNS